MRRLLCRYRVAFLLLVIFDAFAQSRAGRHIGVRNSTDAHKTAFIKAVFNQTASDLFNEEDFRVNCSVPVCVGELADIYCGGSLLFASRYFGFEEFCPGLRLTAAPSVVLKNFENLKRPLNRTEFKKFCDENFANSPYLKAARLVDWKAMPASFEAIADSRIKKFAVRLHNIWPSLSREFVADVHANETLYPVLAVPNRFIVPGGSFQIYFYWDTYWILKGLLFSELFETALGILRNFALIVRQRGFIPNSGSIELSRRSQPPLFIQMLYDYYGELGDESTRTAFLDEFLTAAQGELQWWDTNRAVTVIKDSKTYRLYQYRSETNCPRPENLLEDYFMGTHSDLASTFVWSSTASACESGLDFSQRWFAPGVTNRTGMQTNFVVPVDLNVFLAQNFRIMSEFYRKRNAEKSAYYGKMFLELRDGIDAVFFNSKYGVWFDYDVNVKKLNRVFYPSNIYPLLLATPAKRRATAKCAKILNYLDDLKIFDYKGGVPSSLANDSKEQWDFPNTWAPSNHLFVASLFNCDSVEARDKAKKIADAFFFTVYNGLFHPASGLPAQVWEKYDVRFDNGRSGFGGEYPAQVGFGWTNGAVLDFIRKFYAEKKLIYSDKTFQQFNDFEFRKARNPLMLAAILPENIEPISNTIIKPNRGANESTTLHSAFSFLGVFLCVMIVILYFYAGVSRKRVANRLSSSSLPILSSNLEGSESELQRLLT